GAEIDQLKQADSRAASFDVVVEQLAERVSIEGDLDTRAADPTYGRQIGNGSRSAQPSAGRNRERNDPRALEKPATRTISDHRCSFLTERPDHQMRPIIDLSLRGPQSNKKACQRVQEPPLRRKYSSFQFLFDSRGRYWSITSSNRASEMPRPSA